jgi:hypothetical protein
LSTSSELPPSQLSNDRSLIRGLNFLVGGMTGGELQNAWEPFCKTRGVEFGRLGGGHIPHRVCREKRRALLPKPRSAISADAGLAIDLSIRLLNNLVS